MIAQYEKTCFNPNLSSEEQINCREYYRPILEALFEAAAKEQQAKAGNESGEAFINKGGSQQYGTPVYREDQCIGAVVNGVCHGTILAPGYNAPRCYGQMLFGKCTGPMF